MYSFGKNCSKTFPPYISWEIAKLCAYCRNCSFCLFPWAHGVNVTFWTIVSRENSPVLGEDSLVSGFWNQLGIPSTLLSGCMKVETLLYPSTGSNHREDLRLSNLIIKHIDWPQINSLFKSLKTKTGTWWPPVSLFQPPFLATSPKSSAFKLFQTFPSPVYSS